MRQHLTCFASISQTQHSGQGLQNQSYMIWQNQGPTRILSAVLWASPFTVNSLGQACDLHFLHGPHSVSYSLLHCSTRNFVISKAISLGSWTHISDAVDWSASQLHPGYNVELLRFCRGSRNETRLHGGLIPFSPWEHQVPPFVKTWDYSLHAFMSRVTNTEVHQLNSCGVSLWKEKGKGLSTYNSYWQLSATAGVCSSFGQ